MRYGYYFGSGSDLNGLSSSNVINVASHISRSDILDRAVVWWRSNVTSSTVSRSLINIVNPCVEDGGVRVGSGHDGSGSEES